MKSNKTPFSFENDIPSSIVVFFVALPLCLGIAHISKAPLISGIIAGIIGGVVVGIFSGSKFGVSGPANGAMSIVAGAIASFGGSFEMFLASVVLAGIFLILMGIFKLGFIAFYFPNSVIKGMLAGIGLTIFFKQIPHALGDDQVDEGAEGMVESGIQNLWNESYNMVRDMNFGALIIFTLSVLIIISFSSKKISENKILKFIPASMIAVVIAIILNYLFGGIDRFELKNNHLVQLNDLSGPSDFFKNITFPNFTGAFKNSSVWVIAFTIAIISSLETLLSVEATDKLDPTKTTTPPNKELIAQGIGNIVSGLIGGLPITQVVVRSSANINAGAKSKLSTILHGSWLLLSVLFIPGILQLIPLAALAAVLIIVGYKLAHPKLFKATFDQGWNQFLPFLVTTFLVWKLGILWGVGIGLGIAFLFILYNNFSHSFYVKKEAQIVNEPFIIHLSEHMSFLNKASLIKVFKDIPNESEVILDMNNTLDMDADIAEVINNFSINSKERKIKFSMIGIDGKAEDQSIIEFLFLKKQKLINSKSHLPLAQNKEE